LLVWLLLCSTPEPFGQLRIAAGPFLERLLVGILFLVGLVTLPTTSS